MNITENQFFALIPENKLNTINVLVELKKEIEKYFKIMKN